MNIDVPVVLVLPNLTHNYKNKKKITYLAVIKYKIPSSCTQSMQVRSLDLLSMSV